MQRRDESIQESCQHSMGQHRIRKDCRRSNKKTSVFEFINMHAAHRALTLHVVTNEHC